MITTIIFDVDGVLVHGERFGDVLSREYKVDAQKEREFFSTHFQECLVGKADLKEAVAPYLVSFGWTRSVDDFLEYWFTVEQQINDELIRYVQELRKRGIVCVLATNQEKYRTEYLFDKLGLRGSFDKAYSSAHLGLKKPAVEFFAKVVEDLSANKDEVLFWDDDQINIDGALAYGIHSEFYTDYITFLSVMRQKYSIT